MKTSIPPFILALAALASGCATTPPQQPVNLAEEALGPKAGRVGVVMTPLPKVDTQFPGAGCLLCIAAANAMHSSLTSYTQTLPHEDLPKLKEEVANRIRKKGADAMVIAEPLKLEALPDRSEKALNFAPKDFTPLKAKYNVDKLLVIDITALGIHRPYSAYVPTGDPRIVLEGKAYLVNLSNNSLELYRPVRITRTAEGKWDEAPKYPGLTNAYFQALEMGKDEVLQPFGK